MSSEVEYAQNRLIEEWLRPAIGPDVNPRFDTVRTSEIDGEQTVLLTLLHIVPAPPARSSAAPAPLQLRTSYLVTTQGFKPTEGAQILADLAFQAGTLARVELDPTPPSPSMWEALGVHARPALMISVLLQRERDARPVRRVLEPLVTRWAPSRPVVGVVMGPGDVPIAGALVEVDGSTLATYSNHRGEFGFRAVPGAEPPPILIISAKGAHLRVRVAADKGPADPILIRVPLPEP